MKTKIYRPTSVDQTTLPLEACSMIFSHPSKSLFITLNRKWNNIQNCEHNRLIIFLLIVFIIHE